MKYPVGRIVILNLLGRTPGDERLVNEFEDSMQ